MIATLPSSKWPASEWILRLIESGLLERQQPVQLSLSFEVLGTCQRSSRGYKLCAVCGKVPVNIPSNGGGNKRCTLCWLAHKRVYWSQRHLQKKIARQKGFTGAEF